MDNTRIVEKLKLTASLLELHSENPFKVNSYNSAAWKIEKTEVDLSQLSIEQLENLEGVGKSIAKIIDQLNQHGEFELLNHLLEITPQGVIDMLKIQGVGPKKIGVIWRELNIENAHDLLKACEEGKLAKLKGFGTKIQENIIHAIKYKKSVQNKFLYREAEKIANDLVERIKSALNPLLISLAGELRRNMEIINTVELVVAVKTFSEFAQQLDKWSDIEKKVSLSGPFCWRGRFITPHDLDLNIWLCSPEQFHNTLIRHTGNTTHLSTQVNESNLLKVISEKSLQNETEAYRELGLPFIPPELREGMFEYVWAGDNQMPSLVEYSDLKGILHNHSSYSDGKQTLREMSVHCKELGFEYFGITDHSKTAIYANGLEEDRIKKQHQEIDQLNQELAPFKIFKGIESDILLDGSLDYNPEILETFDFVVASIHSSFSMDSEKTTSRLLNTIRNPHTTILGHLTGRLLLKRDGYPLDHKAIIDACAEHQVIIEINANPLRLDLDWRWVPYAMEKQVLITINPDAHNKKDLELMYYGVCAGRKGGLTKEYTLNCLNLFQIDEYFKTRKHRALKASKVNLIP